LKLRNIERSVTQSLAPCLGNLQRESKFINVNLVSISRIKKMDPSQTKLFINENKNTTKHCVQLCVYLEVAEREEGVDGGVSH
jgi:hypothetical protein